MGPPRSQIGQLRPVAMVAWGNLISRWPRALVALIAVTLGVALVAAVTTGYESSRQTILDWNYSWVGHSHVHIQPIPDQLWANPRMTPALVERIAALPGVRQTVTRQKEHLLVLPEAGPGEIVIGQGIDVSGESRIRNAGIRLAENGGRPLDPGASGEVLIEQHLAQTTGKGVGDKIRLAALPLRLWVLPAVLRDRLARPREFTIVGVIQRPRFSMVSSASVGEGGDDSAPFRLRDLVMISQADMNRLYGEPIGYESADLILADPTTARMNQTADRVRELIRQYNAARPDEPLIVEVETAEQKMRQLDRNMHLFRQASQTVSLVALLTASFIIFTTLGMGMVRRQAELGMLRCVGAGRLHLAAATVGEAVPIAVAGVALGLGGGVLTARAVIGYYHAFFTRVVVSVEGLVWAGAGGLAAVALAVALPTWLASRVSPMAATRPQARRMTLRLDVILGAIGLALIAGSFATRSRLWPGQTGNEQAALYLRAGVPMLYAGYFLIAPLVMATVGRVLKFVSAGLLWVRPRLLDDQMQTGRWRTAATFAALMVGLSMLVNLRVHSESVIRGWELPTDLPPGFLYFFEQLDRRQLLDVAGRPEIHNAVPLMTPWVRTQPPGASGDESIEARFIAGPLQRFDQLGQLSFTELPPGRDGQWAIDRVRAGGAVLATREFATRHGVAVGDRLPFWRHDRSQALTLEIVGVVQSPALDMAIDFMNVRDRFQNLQSASLIGNVNDANRLLSAEYPVATTLPDQLPGDLAPPLPLLTRILLFDFEPGPGPQAPLANEPRGGRSERQLERLATELKDSGYHFYAGSLDELREMIVGEFRSIVRILQKLALWATAIASLGVGFSMAANVQSRRRQLAVLRAVGATRFQLVRLVLAEAITIALLGSLMGVVHGLNLAINAVYFDRQIFGLQPQLTFQPLVIAGAIGFAVLCCLVASLIPAMRASRTNILAAMRQL